MIKKFRLLFSLFFCCLGLLGPTSPPAEASPKELRLVCTILPVYCFTLNIVGQTPGVKVELLLPPTQGCPHNYDLTPGDLITLSRADLIIANGLGMEEFLEKPLRRSNPRAKLILAAAGVPPISGPHPEQPKSLPKARAPLEHSHPQALNGHAWTSPLAALTMVETIARGLAQNDPGRAAFYLENARGYSLRLQALFEEMKGITAASRNNRVVTFHDGFDYLARDIGLEVVGLIQSRLGAEPSPRDLARLVNRVKIRRPAAIFSEPQYSDRMARTLSRETGVPVYRLDPVATGQPMAQTYEKAQMRNISVLRQALKGSL